MQINLKDLDFKDGKYVYTFKPDKDFDSIDLLSDCFGDLAISHLQVEKNPDATYFVPPEVYEGNLGGIFKDLGELKMELKDKDNSDLWGQIRITAQGMLKEYHDTEFKSALAQTAKQLTAQLEDGESLARRILTAQGFQSYMTDKDKQVSSEITQIKDLIGQRVTKKEVEGIIGNSGDSIWLQVKDKVKATADGSKMSGDEILAEINMTNGLTKIKNKLIHLDGDTVMTNAFAKNLLVENLQVNDVKAFTGKFANIIANNLDINNLSGNLAKLGQAIFDGRNSRVRIDPTGMQVMTTSGSYSTKFNDNGIQIWRSGVHVGSIVSADFTGYSADLAGMKSISLAAERNGYLSLSYKDSTSDRYIQMISINARTGRLNFGAPIYTSNSDSCMKFVSTDFPGPGGGRQKGVGLVGKVDGGSTREFGISADGDFWMPMSNGYIINASDIYERLVKLERKVK